MQVVTREEMRELDRLTIEVHGTPGHVLMERAGAGAAAVFWSQFPRVRTRPLVVAGKGNNGGDGLVVARLLQKRGARCDVILLAQAADLQGDAASNLRAFVRNKGRVIEAPGHAGIAALAQLLPKSRVIIDAILGTGLNAPVRGTIAEIISLMNVSGLPIFSIDIPSGLDADRGRPLGVSVQAEATATFGFPKVGQLLYPGATFVGELVIVDIGIAPGAVAKVNPATVTLSAAEAGVLLPSRAAEAHKGDGGHVAIFAGGRGKLGAAILAAEGAARTGAGLTTLVVPETEETLVVSQLREVMCTTLSADPARAFAAPVAEEVAAVLAGKAAAVIGPGIGVGKGASALVQELIRSCGCPLVIDADGLNCITGNPTVLRQRPAPTVLTPHPGEMSRLMGLPVGEVQADRVLMARKLAGATGACVVLKGARTVIAPCENTVAINTTGNPGMASGGMGDVLAGVIGALCAQGLTVEAAAESGVYIHGMAGDLAAASRGGEIGILASDVIDALPRAIATTQSAAARGEQAERTTTRRPAKRGARRTTGHARNAASRRSR